MIAPKLHEAWKPIPKSRIKKLYQKYLENHFDEAWDEGDHLTCTILIDIAVSEGFFQLADYMEKVISQKPQRK